MKIAQGQSTETPTPKMLIKKTIDEMFVGALLACAQKQKMFF